MKFYGGPHSPSPYHLVEARGQHGHLILDALGDSIGALASRTGDHPAAEQLANARLFRAAPELLELVIELVMDLASAEGADDPAWATDLIDQKTRFHDAPGGSAAERARVLVASLGPNP